MLTVKVAFEERSVGSCVEGPSATESDHPSVLPLGPYAGCPCPSEPLLASEMEVVHSSVPVPFLASDPSDSEAQILVSAAFVWGWPSASVVVAVAAFALFAAAAGPSKSANVLADPASAGRSAVSGAC